MTLETEIVAKFIVTRLKAEPLFSANLPGGVHKANAPAGASYPFLVFAYATGANSLAINSAGLDYVIGGGLQFLLKVTDRSESSGRASSVAAWVEETLHENNGAVIDGAAVYVQKDSPYDLPLLEQDIKYQQIGGMYRFFADNV